MQPKTNISDVLKRLWVYVIFPVVAILIVADTVHYWEPREHFGILLTYTLLTLVCTFAPVRTLSAILTINNAVILSGILLEGTWVAVWSGIVEILILSFVFKSSLMRSLANAGQMLATIWIVGEIYAWFQTLSVPWVVADLLLIPLYWLINIGLCAILVSYYSKISWLDASKNMVKVGASTYMMLMVIGSIGGRFVDAYGPLAMIPLGAAFVATSVVFRQYFKSHTQLENKIEEVENLNHSFMTTLAAAIDARDPYTSGHSQRVAHWARELARSIGLPQEKVEEIYFGGILHDIGKIGIKDDILHKDGILTPGEFEQIKLHTVIGYEILKQAGVHQELLPAIRSHHERVDGTGYPDGLHGEEIPLSARILAVADAFDAMVSDRPYRHGMPVEEALRQIEEGAGTQFDVQLAESFVRLVRTLPKQELETFLGHLDPEKYHQLREALH